MLRLTEDKIMVGRTWSLLGNCPWLEEDWYFLAAFLRSFSEHRLLRGEQKQGDKLAQRFTHLPWWFGKGGMSGHRKCGQWRTQLQAYSDSKHRWYQPH